MTIPRRLLVAGSATLVVATLLAGLGTWQMRRMAWKHALIAEVRERTAAPATDAPALGSALADDPAIDYRVVRVEGRFLADREAHVTALLGEPLGRFGGPGQWVMTPLVRDDGSIVWINRGFVPVGRLGAAAPPPAGRVGVEGLARRVEPRGAFTPADDPARDQWFVRDARRLSAAKGLAAERTVPYTIDAGAGATPASGLPQAGETRLTFTDNHLGYALTWYGLALAVLGVFAARARAELARTPRAPETATKTATAR